MKLTCDRAQLLSAAAAVLHAADEVGHGLLAAAPDATTLAVGGSDIGARTALAAAVDRGGSAVLPLRQLARWLRESAAESVRLIAGGRGGVIHGTRRERFEFPAADPATIPAALTPPDAATATLDAAAFRRAVARTAFAVDRRPGQSNWATTGVRFELGPDGLTLAATDTLRLAAATVPLADAPGSSAAATVPAPTVRWWAAAAPEGAASLSLWSHGAAFACGPLSAWTTLLAGLFPQWRDQKVGRRHRATLPGGELGRAVRLALAAADPEAAVDARERGVVVRIGPRSLTVRGETAGAGMRSAGEVSLPNYKGSAFSVQIDGFRLGEYLKAVEDEETVVFRWDSAVRPVEFAAGAGSRYLACPLVEREGGKRGEE